MRIDAFAASSGNTIMEDVVQARVDAISLHYLRSALPWACNINASRQAEIRRLAASKGGRTVMITRCSACKRADVRLNPFAPQGNPKT